MEMLHENDPRAVWLFSFLALIKNTKIDKNLDMKKCKEQEKKSLIISIITLCICL